MVGDKNKQNRIKKVENKKKLDPRISVTFSILRSIKEDMDQRAKSLRMSRTDYIRALVLWELDRGPEAAFDLPRRPRRSDG